MFCLGFEISLLFKYAFLFTTITMIMKLVKFTRMKKNFQFYRKQGLSSWL